MHLPAIYPLGYLPPSSSIVLYRLPKASDSSKTTAGGMWDGYVGCGAIEVRFVARVGVERKGGSPMPRARTDDGNAKSAGSREGSTTSRTATRIKHHGLILAGTTHDQGSRNSDLSFWNNFKMFFYKLDRGPRDLTYQSLASNHGTRFNS